VYIKDPAVSQKHAVIQWTGEEFTVTDLGSSNGTLVNDEEIEEDVPFTIKNGDFLVVGTDTTVKVSIVATEEKKEPAPKAARGAAARAAAAAKRETEKAEKLEAEKAKKEQKAKEAKAKAEKEEKQKLEREEADSSPTVEHFLTSQVERMTAEVKSLAEKTCTDLLAETESIKNELRVEVGATA
tara:strand:+ start:159 stop:710 length:552 start_codon:yes stop_codon:yes gene_type:complete